MSGAQIADKFPHLQNKKGSRQLENRQIWVKFLITYIIFACMILAHTYPESFLQKSIITISREKIGWVQHFCLFYNNYSGTITFFFALGCQGCESPPSASQTQRCCFSSTQANHPPSFFVSCCIHPLNFAL